MNSIEIIRLTKKFGNHKAVDDLNIQVKKGSICGFLGKNGAGKTTTIKMLVGLLEPNAGTIRIMGQERKFGKLDNSKIGYLPDVPNFYGYMTAAEYLDFCAQLYGMDNKKRKVVIDELLKKVDLYGVKTKIQGFSRGMKQRLGIAQALINEPEVVYMDEPISALDPIGRHEVMEIIRSLRGAHTIFFSTHVLSDVENVCDHAIILDKGKVLINDTIENIKKEYANNSIKIRLYYKNDSEKFLNVMKGNKFVEVKKVNSLEYILRGLSVENFGKNYTINIG